MIIMSMILIFITRSSIVAFR